MKRFQYHATTWESVPSILKNGLRLPTGSGSVATHRYETPSISTANDPASAQVYHPHGALLKIKILPGAKYIKREFPRSSRKGENLEQSINRWLQEAQGLGADGVEVNLQSTIGNQTINPKVLQVVEVVNEEDAPTMRTSAQRVAARYKNKKKVKTQKGNELTVYEYSDRQIADRHRKKAERLEALQKAIPKLQTKVKQDLTAKDEKKRLTALAVALINTTYERVGNPESAAKGHYGVTGWLTKHVKFPSDGKAKVTYIGKSGVKHTKVVEDKAVIKALKGAIKGKSPEESIFMCSGSKDCLSPADVNKYLEPYDITAKDLRGFRANEEMRNALAAIRKDGPELPRPRKERDKILKAEFKKALADVAKIVGHTPAMLRSDYLVPGLEDEYMKNGVVGQNLKNTPSKKASETANKIFIMRSTTPWASHMKYDHIGFVLSSGKLRDMSGHRYTKDGKKPLPPVTYSWNDLAREVDEQGKKLFDTDLKSTSKARAAGVNPFRYQEIRLPKPVVVPNAIACSISNPKDRAVNCGSFVKIVLYNNGIDLGRVGNGIEDIANGVKNWRPIRKTALIMRVAQRYLNAVSNMVFYHGTDMDNLPNIARKGLVPRSGIEWDGGQAFTGVGHQAVYLTPNFELAARYAVGSHKGQKPSVLEVQISMSKRFKLLSEDPMDIPDSAWEVEESYDDDRQEVEYGLESVGREVIKLLGAKQNYRGRPMDIWFTVEPQDLAKYKKGGQPIRHTHNLGQAELEFLDGVNVYKALTGEIIKAIEKSGNPHLADRKRIMRLVQNGLKRENWQYIEIRPDGTMKLTEHYFATREQLMFLKGLPPSTIKGVWVRIADFDLPENAYQAIETYGIQELPGETAGNHEYLRDLARGLRWDDPTDIDEYKIEELQEAFDGAGMDEEYTLMERILDTPEEERSVFKDEFEEALEGLDQYLNDIWFETKTVDYGKWGKLPLAQASRLR